ncbi:MAG: glycosyltransferase family 9 protein [Bacteroidia bacterium]
MKRILIFRTGGIGDVILSSVALNVINSCEISCEIIWAGRTPCIDLIKDCYPNIHTFNLDKSKSNFKLFIELKSKLKGLDLIIDLQKSPRTILMSFLLKFKFFRAKYVTWNKLSLQRTWMVFRANLRGRKQIEGFLIKALPSRVELMADCCIRGLRKLSINPSKTKLTPRLIKSDEKENYMAFCLGSLYPLKELSITYQKTIISYCFDTLKLQTLYLLGDVNKQLEAEALQNHFSTKNIVNLCGKTSLTEAAQILSKCMFSVANDSALAHLSEAVNTPVMMFFGPTHESLGYRPYLKKSMAFSSSITCRPCHKSGNTTCRFGDEKCKTNLPMDSVYRHLQDLV